MITAKNLSKQYPGFNMNISMEIPKGRITGLIGKNGAGKSTFIKSLLGLIRPDEGEITIFGRPAGELTVEDRQRIGTTLAESGFSSYLNIKDIAGILERMYPHFDRNRFLEQCRRFNLPDSKNLQNYSTGMKARLRVLTALSHEADLLIMDEPTSGLDVEAREEILDMIRSYMEADENRSVLITSHIATDLENLCDDIYLIDHGTIILHEDTDVILSDYAVLKLSEEQYAAVDRSHLIGVRKTNYGYDCLTPEKQYYRENYPETVIENAGIDDLIILMTGGKES